MKSQYYYELGPDGSAYAIRDRRLESVVLAVAQEPNVAARIAAALNFHAQAQIIRRKDSMIEPKYLKVGSKVSAETDDSTCFGTVLELQNGEGLVKWKGVANPTWLDTMDLHQRDGAPFGPAPEPSP